MTTYVTLLSPEEAAAAFVRPEDAPPGSLAHLRDFAAEDGDRTIPFRPPFSGRDVADTAALQRLLGGFVQDLTPRTPEMIDALQLAAIAPSDLIYEVFASEANRTGTDRHFGDLVAAGIDAYWVAAWAFQPKREGLGTHDILFVRLR